ncbi:hypothetical protein BU17DRAFT_79650 [Hysterangium stoloniferum]|nr:hypothetical protein BU17DRAFT_79650 [Hysterangium stoloniferum]
MELSKEEKASCLATFRAALRLMVNLHRFFISSGFKTDFVSPLGFANTLKQIFPRHIRELCLHEFDVSTNSLNEWLQIFHFSYLTQLSIAVYPWEPPPDADQNLLTILCLAPRLRDLYIGIPYAQPLLAALRNVHFPELLRLTIQSVKGRNEVLREDESQDIMFNFFRRHNKLMSLSLTGPLLARGIFHTNSLPGLRSLDIWPYEAGISDLLPVGFGKQLRYLELTAALDAKCFSPLSHMAELVILKVSVKCYSSLMELSVLPNLQVLDLTCYLLYKERHDLDQFLSQLYKFPNLRYLSMYNNLFSSSDASIICKKVTEILTLLKGLRVKFHDGKDTKTIEIQWIHDQSMCRYTTNERQGTSMPFEMWKGMKYSDDFCYGGLRHR